MSVCVCVCVCVYECVCVRARARARVCVCVRTEWRPTHDAWPRPARRVAVSLCTLLAIAIASACGGAGESKSGALAAFGPTLTSASGAHYLKHEIIILRDPSSSDKDYQNALAHLHAGKVDDQNEITEQLGYIRVELAKEISVDDAISYLHRQNVVLEAERNYLVKHSAIPNDTLYPELWNMERIGMPTAWDLTTGSADVVVAISDTGIDT